MAGIRGGWRRSRCRMSSTLNPMRKRWHPTPQECKLIADMLDANRPKAAIARFVYVSESTLRRFLARVRERRTML